MESLKHTTLLDNTIGSQVYEPLLKTMYRDVAYVNNSKLTDTLQNWHFYLPKGQSQLDHLQTVPWILSWTFLRQMGLTPSWSWSIKALVRG